MNLVLGIYQQGFREGCLAHMNIAMHEMRRYCTCRGRNFRYLSTVNCGFPLPQGIFYPNYGNVYVYVLCHTVNKRGDEQLQLNGKENPIYDDELIKELKKIKCKQLSLVLETCHSEGIVGPEDEPIPSNWNVVTTCARDEKSLYSEKEKMGCYTKALKGMSGNSRIPVFAFSPEIVCESANRMMRGMETTSCKGNGKWLDTCDELLKSRSERRCRYNK